jgi:cell division protein YceG involved in septum cleavage
MKYLRRISVALVLLLLLAAGAVIWNGARSLDAPLNLHDTLRFRVSPGMSFARLATELAAQGVVAQPKAWILYARWMGLASAKGR